MQKIQPGKFQPLLREILPLLRDNLAKRQPLFRENLVKRHPLVREKNAKTHPFARHIPITPSILSAPQGLKALFALAVVHVTCVSHWRLSETMIPLRYVMLLTLFSTCNIIEQKFSMGVFLGPMRMM